ncbi:hypothetical protein V3H18_02395 [Methylocystis sp. 9N]|uniref:Uncharacterized protein n=1 Tax=Methylocystis borbori TaxID=3118750 RepID=A0ABU7XEB0_9HYPH
MRYVLAAIFVCSASLPAAATPPISLHPVSASKADPIAQIAKRNRQTSTQRSGRNSSGSGIHPLVGSGDY